MSLPVYPKLLGEAYPVLRESVHSTIVQSSASGKRVRVALYSQPLYRWTIPYGYLCHDPTVAPADLQVLQGLYDDRHGRLSEMRFDDITDNYTVASTIGVGDGATLAFQLARSFGSSSHMVYDVHTDPTSTPPIAAPLIYINGSLAGGYTISADGLVTFGSAPGNGADITATFSYYFRVTFDDDSLEFTNDFGPYWSIKQVRLLEVKP